MSDPIDSKRGAVFNRNGRPARHLGEGEEQVGPGTEPGTGTGTE
jgi:hypothetical protein